MFQLIYFTPPDVILQTARRTTLGEYTKGPRFLFTGHLLIPSPHRRNLTCIACGSPRVDQPSLKMANAGRSIPVSLPSVQRYNPPPRSFTPSSPHNPDHQSATAFLPSPATARPLLTPSGRAFAVGGRVQNISSDPLAPCIMYWPDNEPLPEQGQIRPPNLLGAPVSHLCPCDDSRTSHIDCSFLAPPHLEHR